MRSSAGSTLKIPRKAFVLLREKFLRFIFQGETESGWIRESTAVIRCRPTYDSMVAKLIVHGKDRAEAIAKMRSALGETILDGIDTNIDYQYEILSDPDYQAGNFDIEFLNTHRIGGISNGL